MGHGSHRLNGQSESYWPCQTHRQRLPAWASNQPVQLDPNISNSLFKALISGEHEQSFPCGDASWFHSETRTWLDTPNGDVKQKLRFRLLLNWFNASLKWLLFYSIEPSVHAFSPQRTWSNTDQEVCQPTIGKWKQITSISVFKESWLIRLRLDSAT